MTKLAGYNCDMYNQPFSRLVKLELGLAVGYKKGSF